LNRFILALALAAGCASQLRADQLAAGASATSFALLPAERCDQAFDVRLCEVADPKPWSAGERPLIEDSLRRLAANELVQGLLVAAQDNGYEGLRRFATDTQPDAALGRVAKFSPGFVIYRSKVIAITDAFFATRDVVDTVSGYRFGDLILVHELVHAFDDRKTSAEAGFPSVAGWTFQNSRWEYTRPFNWSAYSGVFSDASRLYAGGRYDEAWARDRSFAMSLAFPLPTIQSLATPAESFADILAHLIVDPKAPGYLHPELVQWFERKMFPLLREKARRFVAADCESF
jgi:hypothetical protein